MKKAIFTLALCLVAAFAANAQKYACVNTEYILSNIPDYDQAQQTLDKFSVDWQKEIEAKFTNIIIKFFFVHYHILHLNR